MNIKHQVIDGPHGRPILLDLKIPENPNGQVIIFCHGYKGFKDWGCWNLVGSRFAGEQYTFIKFNFSHNGGTVEQPLECPDPEAFAQNNFTKEMDDLDTVINWITEEVSHIDETIRPEQLHLLGHSRGGGIVTLKASEDPRITSVSSWAGVSDFKSRFSDTKTIAYWKKTGVIYIENSRTKQQLPHYYQFYEDFITHEDRFNIQKAAKNLEIPHLIVHGTQDPTVDLQEAKAVKKWNPNAQLHIIEGADHVFGGTHPWNRETLPAHMAQAVDATLRFLS